MKKFSFLVAVLAIACLAWPTRALSGVALDQINQYISGEASQKAPTIGCTAGNCPSSATKVASTGGIPLDKIGDYVKGNGDGSVPASASSIVVKKSVKRMTGETFDDTMTETVFSDGRKEISWEQYGILTTGERVLVYKNTRTVPGSPDCPGKIAKKNKKNNGEKIKTAEGTKMKRSRHTDKLTLEKAPVPKVVVSGSSSATVFVATGLFI